MKIRLKEIPAEGRAYFFDRQSGELNPELEDLISKHPYQATLFIKPIGDAYDMRGEVQTTVNEVCSKCGWEVETPVDTKFHEILVEEKEDYRKSHSVHGNQSVDFLENEISSVPYKGGNFEAGEYLHEAIALATPLYPTCGPNDQCLHQEEIDQIKQRLEAEFATADQRREGHPAFSVLKTVEVAKKH